MNLEPSVGIIGGADGPTAIFITAGDPMAFVLSCAGIAAAVAAAVLLIIRLLKKSRAK